jgi:hypothetical protein
MQTTDEKVYDLNLSERYVPHWGAWEIGREIIANAIDADPKGFTVEPHGENMLRVFTNTVPTLSQIKVIGAGTKSKNGKTIGQFGEGFKLATLAAVRAGGSITLLTGNFIARFHLETIMEGDEAHRILFMRTTPPDSPYVGCEIYIEFPGIAQAIKDRFLFEGKPGPMEKREEEAMNLFVHGVFVQRIEQHSMFDWNVENVEINRDRSIVDRVYINREIAYWFNKKMNSDLAEQLMKAEPGCVELRALEQWPEAIDRPAKAMLVCAMKKIHGADVIIATGNTTANKLAAAKGMTVIVLDEGLAKVIKPRFENDEGVRDSEQMLQTGGALQAVSIHPEWVEAIKEIEDVIDLLGIPAEMRFFQHFENAELGLAVLRPDHLGCTLWINERLFLPGNRRERMSTAIHELCHIRDKGNDGSIEFEKTLDNVAGILALAWLDGRKS